LRAFLYAARVTWLTLRAPLVQNVTSMRIGRGYVFGANQWHLGLGAACQACQNEQWGFFNGAAARARRCGCGARAVNVLRRAAQAACTVWWSTIAPSPTTKSTALSVSAQRLAGRAPWEPLIPRWRPAVLPGQTPPPSMAPTSQPTATPTGAPTSEPTGTPSEAPTTAVPTAPSAEPTAEPTDTPTRSPDWTDFPTGVPTDSPTAGPTLADGDTYPPTRAPSAAPSAVPTFEPGVTAAPSAEPTFLPSAQPTGAPTFAGIVTCPPDVVLRLASNHESAGGTLAGWSAPTAVGVLSGTNLSSSVTCDRNPDTLFPAGRTAVTCSLPDAGGSCQFNVVLPLVEYHFYEETVGAAPTGAIAQDRAGSMDLFGHNNVSIVLDPVLNVPVLRVVNERTATVPALVNASYVVTEAKSSRIVVDKTIIVFINPDAGSALNALGQIDGGEHGLFITPRVGL
jgi:hypothetical protein